MTLVVEMRLSRSSEPLQKHEPSCMWGMFNVIESCHDQTCGKLISNGSPLSKPIIDSPRKIAQLASFDEECRRIQIQNKAGLGNGKADIYMPSETHETIYHVIRQHHHDKIDPGVVDFLAKGRNRAKERCRKGYPSSCYSNDPASSYHQLFPASSKLSLNGVTLAAILRTGCVHNRQEESIQTAAKAFVDRMFIHRKLVSKGMVYSQSKSGEDMFGGHFSDTTSLLPRPVKSSTYSRTKKETLKSILDRKEAEGLDSGSSSGKPGSLSASINGNMGKNSWSKYTRTRFVEHPSDRIVVLKPAPQKSATLSENVNCHCSSLQPHRRIRTFSDAKRKPFSFKEMKRKLRHKFGGTRKEPSKFLNFESQKKSDVPRGSGSIPPCEQVFDVILEAKNHLSARLKNVDSAEKVTGKKSPKTLRRILSSPEKDFQPIGLRSDGVPHGSEFDQMILSPYSGSARVAGSFSEMPKGKEGARPSRLNSEVASCDFVCENLMLETMGTEMGYSLTPSSDEEACDASSSSTGGSKIDDMQCVQASQLLTSEMSTETDSYGVRKVQLNEATEAQKAGETDSMSENEVSTSAIDDLPSTPSSILHSDTADTIKHQREHLSPVSVLDLFTKDSNSPPSATLQTGQFSSGQQFKPRRIDFEQYSPDPPLHDPPNSSKQENDHLFQYVHSVLEASCLDWDQLSEIAFPHEEILDPFLFHEVGFSPINCCFDPKLLFDRINETLLEMYKFHFGSPLWPTFSKPMIRPEQLAELVLDEIMKEANPLLLLRTEERTLEQLVSKDVARCGSWIDVRGETDEIVNEISEECVEECVLEVLPELYTWSLYTSYM